MKIEILKAKDVPQLISRSKNYGELIIKYQELGEDEVIKVKVDTAGQASAISQLFHRRGIKVRSRTLDGTLYVLITKVH